MTEPAKINMTDEQFAEFKAIEVGKAEIMAAHVSAQIDYMSATKAVLEIDGPKTTLRDQFAMSVLSMALAEQESPQATAAYAYAVADAMMEARR